MRNITVAIIVAFSAFALAFSASADDPTARAAAAAALGMTRAPADPAVQRINMPISVVPGAFSNVKRIFPLVDMTGGNEKDKVRAESALKAVLMKWAPQCNFMLVGGTKAPVASITCHATPTIDIGQSQTSTNRSDTSGSSDSYRSRYGSYSRIDGSSSHNSGEAAFAATSMGVEFYVNELDGSTTTLAAVANIFSAESQRTASSDQQSSFYSYSSTTKRWGTNSYQDSHSSGSTNRGDVSFATSQSTLHTLEETMEKVVAPLTSAIDYSNYLARQKNAGK